MSLMGHEHSGNSWMLREAGQQHARKMKPWKRKNERKLSTHKSWEGYVCIQLLSSSPVVESSPTEHETKLSGAIHTSFQLILISLSSHKNTRPSSNFSLLIWNNYQINEMVRYCLIITPVYCKIKIYWQSCVPYGLIHSRGQSMEEKKGSMHINLC